MHRRVIKTNHNSQIWTKDATGYDEVATFQDMQGGLEFYKTQSITSACKFVHK